jgi:hypothetical protein
MNRTFARYFRIIGVIAAVLLPATTPLSTLAAPAGQRVVRVTTHTTTGMARGAAHTKSHVRVSVTQNPDGSIPPGGLFTYSIKVENTSRDTASGTWVGLSLDPNVEVLDFHSGNPTIFVDYLGADSIHVRFHDVGAGDSATVQVMARVRPTAAQPATISSRATANWLGKNSLSNLVQAKVGTAADMGKHGLLYMASGTFRAQSSQLNMNTDIFGSAEPVSFWVNTPSGVVPVAGLGLTDRTGTLSFTIDTSGLSSGSYSLVAHGIETGVEELFNFSVQ